MSRIRKGMCHGCPYNFGDEHTEAAYNLGCLPSVGEIKAMTDGAQKDWACHSEPEKECCGYAAQTRGKAEEKPLLVNGYHGA